MHERFAGLPRERRRGGLRAWRQDPRTPSRGASGDLENRLLFFFILRGDAFGEALGKAAEKFRRLLRQATPLKSSISALRSGREAGQRDRAHESGEKVKCHSAAS